MALTQDEMMKPYATIRWCPADIKSLHEEWSDEKCCEVMHNIAGWLEDRSIELGWEVIQTLLWDYEQDDEEDEDEDE